MIFITVLVIILSYRFFVKLNGKIRVFTITGFFLLNYIVYNLIGSVLLNYIQWEAEYYAGYYENINILHRMWGYVLLGYIGLFVGFVLSHLFFYKHKTKKIQSNGILRPIDFTKFDESNKSYKYVLILFIIAISAMLLYRLRLGRLPIESITSGLDAYELALERSVATNDFSGKVYRYELAFLTIPTFLLILTFLISSKTKQKKWKRIFIFILAFLSFASVCTLQKGPLISMFLLLYIVYVYKERYINLRILLGLGIISVPIILLMYIFFMGKADVPIVEIAETAIHRIFVGAISPFYWYIKYFDTHPFLFGATFPNPGGILPFEHVQLPVMMMNFAYDRGDVVGSMPTVFLGEMYANFGVIGMIISSVLVGFLLQTLDIVFFKAMKHRKTVILSTLYCFIINELSGYAVSSISPLLFDMKLVVVILLFVLYFNQLKKYEARKSLPRYQCSPVEGH